ncbi:alpha/beta fold hydrolase [Sphingomonas hengshuiensis]|uniref:Lysophospholipase n=1 Tax=Sphingomonas hengshuiensis TaxID=1609977 RepID=A0A7U5BEQ1_9SPHN|nr:alpha/beta hydrolase [Sphingomonas hengshuiensis]AJP70931.1 lysophospholipase [Sphingomonas hengshuiensis]
MTASSFDRRSIPAGASVQRWTAPDGWQLRAFAWPADTASPRGSILFQGGRGDVFEKYLEVFAHWHAQGWTVTSFDWRGQGGSGRLSAAANCGHIESFDAFIADLGAFYADWQAATPGPHVVMGHSMGGHLVLRALVEGAIAPDAAVLVAPMLGFRSPFGPLAERMARLLGGVGDSSRPAWKGNEKPYTTDTRASLLTHDPDRYADEIWWQTANPETVTGPPSWRWVIEAFKSMRESAADPRLKALKVPILMLVAKADGLVDARASLRIAPKLPDVRVVAFGAESAHEILREADPVRNRAIGEIDLFLAARAQRA